jgi:hypothetical protein
MNNQLITFNDIKSSVKSLSEHVKEDRVNNAILEAQQLDLKPRIGEQMYIELLETKATPTEAFRALMLGAIYTNPSDGLKYEFAGVKKALSYFAYSRLIKGISSSVASTGFVQKNNDFSQHTQLKEKLAASKDAEITGAAYLQECVDYIKRNPATFPKFEVAAVKRKTSFKVIGD